MSYTKMRVMKIEFMIDGWECGFAREVETTPEVGDLVTLSGDRFIVTKRLTHFSGNQYPYVGIRRIVHEFKKEE